MFNQNLILSTDSYKVSHWCQYPPNTTGVFSYIESRGGDYPETVFFGLQVFLNRIAEGITQADIDEAKDIFAMHGEPFNEKGWQLLLDRHGGKFPVLIRAVPEGMVVPIKNALVTIESTDDDFFWLVSYLETAMLRAVWYPTTVATISWRIKKLIKQYLEDTADTTDGLPFKLHDFGARGVSSAESSAIGGVAHLVNFMGTDNVESLVLARNGYDCKMAGFSIPASEHSTMTSWGGWMGEASAMKNMVDQYGGEGKMYACVSDSYDIHHACANIWGDELKDYLMKRGGTLVVRPDSGYPPVIVLECLEILGDKFGFELNSKGYKVLHPCVRMLQGDGIDEGMINEILHVMKKHNWSADNIAFGMGGALLQHCDRDTMQWAMKCSSARVDGVWIDVFKDPKTDEHKRSKKGRLGLYQEFDKLVTKREQRGAHGDPNVLQVVFRDGRVVRHQTLDEIRERANTAV